MTNRSGASTTRRKKQSFIRKPRTAENDGKNQLETNRTIDYLASESYRLPRKIETLQDAKDYWREEKAKLRETIGRPTYHTQKSFLNTAWKRERIHVSDSNANLPGRSMTGDVDPEFFRIISGRPIKEKTSMAQYLNDIRSCFLTRLKTGYHLDEILLMDQRHVTETKQLNQVRKKFLTIRQSFEDFLREDHIASANLLALARQETEKSKEKLRILNSLRETLKEVEMEILVLEEEWRKSRMFQEFLYVIAPAEWRKVNDPNYGVKESKGSVSDPCLFDRFRDFPRETNPGLEWKISRFVEDIQTCPKPALYFTDPLQIQTVLTELEGNNLRALNHCRKLDFPAENAVTVVGKLKENFEQNLAKLEEDIEYVKNLVKTEEEKAARAEQNLREMTYGLFRKLITDETSLTVTAYLEDAYENVMDSVETNLDPISLVKGIESKYESLSLALDLLPNNLVVQTTKKFYKEQKREMKEAKEAEKKVHQMEMLLKRLSRALEAPRKGTKDRKPISRSQPPEEQLTRPKEAKIFTREEMEKMYLFGRTPETARLHRPLCI